MHHIIIGGSIAGISAAKAIRSSDVISEITIISEERTKPYYRPMIPFLIEKDEIDITFVDDPIGKYGIKVVYEKVTGIDVESKEVLLSSGKRLNFDKLLITTGSSPIIPDIGGLKGSGVFTLRTMDDALGIKEYSKGRRNAVVLGGGLVGIKVAIALKHIGLNVTIIELKQILYGRLDRRGSEIISGIVKKSGVDILTGDSISEIIRESDNIKAVRLSSGRIIDADIVIIAVGAKPNVDSFKNTGIKINKGVAINEYLQTNIPDIYAAGDVAEYPDVTTGMSALSVLWTTAEEMGRLAGKNMAGDNLKYRGFLSVMNSTEIFNIPVISIGLIETGDKDFEIITEEDINDYKKLIFKGNILVGAIFIGNITNAGIYTNLIKNKIPIGRLKQKAVRGTLSYINFVTMSPIQTLTA